MNCSVSSANACKIWSVANATKNEHLIVNSAPQVALNWEICSSNKLFHVNTEVVGMKSLIGCTQMAPVPAKSKLFALSAWMRSARDAEEREARIGALLDFISTLKIELGIYTDLAAGCEELELPRECRLV